MDTVTGSCLCGDVAFECKNTFEQFHFCHCQQSQKATGSAHVADLFTDVANIRWLPGKDKIKRYDVPGRTITSAFCESRGSLVPYYQLLALHLLYPLAA